MIAPGSLPIGASAADRILLQILPACEKCQKSTLYRSLRLSADLPAVGRRTPPDVIRHGRQALGIFLIYCLANTLDPSL